MFKVHRMAEWPQVFPTLADAIGYIRNYCGLWYALEEKQEDGSWLILVGPDASRSPGDNGVEDYS